MNASIFIKYIIAMKMVRNERTKFISNVDLISLLNQATDAELKSLTSVIKGSDYREDSPNMSSIDICRKLLRGRLLKSSKSGRREAQSI